MIAGALCAPVSLAAAVDQSASGSDLGIESTDFAGHLDIEGEWAVSVSSNGVWIGNVSTLETRAVATQGMEILGRVSSGDYGGAAIGSRGVVWSDDGLGQRLSSYEISTSAYSNILSPEIPYRQARPSFSGDWLLFAGNDSSYATIYAANVVSGEIHVVSDSGGGLAPKTDGRYGVWPFGQQLTIMDLATGVRSSLWAQHDGREFAIDAGRVLYYQKIPSGYELRVWDIASSTYIPVVITGSPWEEVDLSGEWVTWQATGNAATGLDVFAKNIVTGESRAVCRAPGAQSDPRISGGYVVWKDPRFAKRSWLGVGFAKLSDCPALDEGAPALSSTSTVGVLSAAVSVDATDSGSGVRRIGFRSGTGAPTYVATATAEITFKAPGAYDLTFWAEDMQGNRSAESTCAFFLKARPLVGVPIAPANTRVGRRFQVVSVVRRKQAPQQGTIRFRLARYSAEQRVWIDSGDVLGRAGADAPARFSARVALKAPGTWRLSAVSPGDASNVGARSSRDAYITVR